MGGALLREVHGGVVAKDSACRVLNVAKLAGGKARKQ